MKCSMGKLKKNLAKKGFPIHSIISILITLLIISMVTHGALRATKSPLKISRVSMIPWQKNVVYLTDTELMIIVWDNYHSKMVNVDVTISGCNITEQTIPTQHWGATYPPFSLIGISLPSGVLNGTIQVLTEKEGLESMTFEIIVVAR